LWRRERNWQAILLREANMPSFSAGSFAYLDPEMHHSAMANGEVIVQIHGMSQVQNSTTSILTTILAGRDRCAPRTGSI
jgi:hypothetical protein